ncbi:MAG: hypothetical protein ACPGVC_06880 [Salibacteraceae bacterium]
MRILLLTISIMFLSSFDGVCQFEDPGAVNNTNSSPSAKPSGGRPLGDNLVVGGGLDLQFGNITAIGVTPLIAYAITDNVLIGSIFTYRYFNDNRAGSSYSTSTYGIAPFARVFVYEGLFIHGEYEMLYGEFDYQREHFWVNSLLAGAGYGSRIGDKGFAGVYLLWNFTEHDIYKIYSNPIIRFSIGVGL